MLTAGPTGVRGDLAVGVCEGDGEGDALRLLSLDEEPSAPTRRSLVMRKGSGSGEKLRSRSSDSRSCPVGFLGLRDLASRRETGNGSTTLASELERTRSLPCVR